MGGLLAAVESRDLRRVSAALSADCTWQNVPHAPVVGRDAVVAAIADYFSTVPARLGPGRLQLSEQVQVSDSEVSVS